MNSRKSRIRILAAWVLGIPSRLACGMIFLYKKYLSPLLPPACRYRPTCSDYCSEAIERYGFFRGGWMGFRRLLRCNPFFKGGFDPVPGKGQSRQGDGGNDIERERQRPLKHEPRKCEKCTNTS